LIVSRLSDSYINSRNLSARTVITMQANVYIVCRVVETDLDSGHTTTATTPLSAYSKQESAVSYAYEIGKIVGDELRIRQLTSVDPMPEVCRSAVAVYLVAGIKCDYYVDSDKCYYCVYDLNLFSH